MAVAALLARITAHGPALIRMPPGGVPELTGEDIALALGLAPECAVWILRAKYMADYTGLMRLESALYEEAERRASKWRGVDPQSEDGAALLSLLVRKALTEAIQPKLCGHCQGRGSRMRGGLLVQCERCNGTGKGRLSERERCQGTGIEYHAWRKTWGPRLDALVRQLGYWESEGLCVIKDVVDY